ncbi:class I SAM-dependent methyltransferase [bacterium]|nr:class I SAM-dependent methyltransferase [bacterium]
MAKLFAPAAERNKEAIYEVLCKWVPKSGNILEIASGTGQHVVYFAEKFPKLNWLPSDIDQEHLECIDERVKESGLTNIIAASKIDTTSSSWAIKGIDLIFCANMIHISPFKSTIGLIEGSSRALKSSGVLVLYGPFKENGVETCESNLNFDESLRLRDSSWGLRNKEEVEKIASENNLILSQRYEMPANNLILVFEKK